MIQNNIIPEYSPKGASRYVNVLADDDDIVQKISHIAEKLDLRRWLGVHTKVVVEKLTSLRDWKGWRLAKRNSP